MMPVEGYRILKGIVLTCWISAGKSYNAIDGNLIAVGSDYYLNFGSFWGDIFQVKLNAAATKGGGAAAYNSGCSSSYFFPFQVVLGVLWPVPTLETIPRSLGTPRSIQK